MGAVAAIRILHRRTLATVEPERLHEVEAELAAEHEAAAGGLDRAVEIGVIDAILEPSQTRRELAKAIAEAPQLRGAHANIPL
jgi:acetyl-CoA/propionyl-CoA carboxylase carboxyl transferase subunit